MPDPPVLYECRDGVALLTLNRPENLNAWTPEMHEGWFDAYDRAAADPACRVIVITGKGRAWCAGADVGRLPGSKTSQDASRDEPKVTPDRNAETGILLDRRGRNTAHALTIPKPIIACIQGGVAGGGFSQMMNCDIRFAAKGAKFTTAFSRRGLVAEMGVSQTLPHAVGMGTAMDIILSGRKFDADEALHLGVVQRVFPSERLLAATLAYARDMAENVPPSSMAVLKQQLLRHYAMPMEQVMRESDRLMIESFRHPEHKEGVRSYIEKRAPSFPAYDDRNGLVAMMKEMQSKL